MKIAIKCEKNVAFDSPDHLSPWGTMRDNSKNKKFNDKLYRLYGYGRQLKILDIGCSGGGFVKNCIDDGHIAVGLEGSDFSKKLRRAEWRIIPENLFTCDITKNFDIFLDRKRLLFDVITAWEVMEHIKREDLAKTLENIKRHMNENVLLIMSISYQKDNFNGVELHQTREKKEWWVKKFREFGFIARPDYEKYFNNQFVRGPLQDFNPRCFNLIVSLSSDKLPKIPKEKAIKRMIEKWNTSRINKLIKMLFGDI